MSRFPTHPHAGLKHKTPEGQRFLYNGRAWLPDRSPEVEEPEGQDLVLWLPHADGAMQLLVGSVLTPAGNDKRTIRFSKPFGADPVVMVSNGNSGLTTMAVSVLRADPSSVMVKTYGYRGEYRVNFLAIGVAP